MKVNFFSYIYFFYKNIAHFFIYIYLNICFRSFHLSRFYIYKVLFVLVARGIQNFWSNRHEISTPTDLTLRFSKSWNSLFLKFLFQIFVFSYEKKNTNNWELKKIYFSSRNSNGSRRRHSKIEILKILTLIVLVRVSNRYSKLTTKSF